MFHSTRCLRSSMCTPARQAGGSWLHGRPHVTPGRSFWIVLLPLPFAPSSLKTWTALLLQQLLLPPCTAPVLKFGWNLNTSFNTAVPESCKKWRGAELGRWTDSCVYGFSSLYKWPDYAFKKKEKLILNAVPELWKVFFLLYAWSY